MIRRIRQRLAEESGASLILVLALMTFLGVVVGALLSYSDGSLKLTTKTYERVKIGNDAGSALQTAINQVRRNNDDVVQSCPTLPYQGQTGLITVNCEAVNGGSGTRGKRLVKGAGYPDRAITTLSTSENEIGLNINPPNNKTTVVQGGIWSNSTIRVRNTTTLDQRHGLTQARGRCDVSGGTFIPSPPDCNIGGPVLPDPAIANLPSSETSYAQPRSGMTYQPVPACPGSGVSIVKFSPGLYDDAAGLTNLFQQCNNRTFWFQPGPNGTVGNYYFDFRNSGSHIWEIKDQNTGGVVGGTPKNWDPNAVPSQEPSFPGACVSPLERTTDGGVEFIFGGDSQLKLSQVQMELCGQYSATRVPFVLYGAKSTILDPQPVQTTKMTTGSGLNNLPDLTFNDKDNIKEEDDVSATASLAGSTHSQGVTGSVTVSGYVPAQAIPAKSTLISAQLVVRHRDNNNSGSLLSGLTTQITPTRTGATALATDNIPQYADGESGGSYHTDTIDVTAKLVDEVYNYGFAGMSVKYVASVASNNTVTENLDAIQLQLTWAPTAVRAQSGCVIAIPGCAFLDAKQNHGGIYAHGTIYAPNAAMDYTSDELAAPQFIVGIIVRRLYLNVQPTNQYTDPIGQLPLIDIGYQDFLVYFTATCAGVPCGTAKVKYTDVLDSPREVNVLSWNVVPQ